MPPYFLRLNMTDKPKPEATDPPEPKTPPVLPSSTQPTWLAKWLTPNQTPVPEKPEVKK